MRLKYLFQVFIFILLLIPLGLAAEDSTFITEPGEVQKPSKIDLGTWTLHGEEREITDLIVFVLIMLIFVVVIYELLAFIGIFEKQWMKWAISVLVVFLTNSNMFLFNTFYALQDFKLIVEKVTSLTGWQVFWWVLGILFLALILSVLKGLFKKFKKGTAHSLEDDQDEAFEISMEGRKKMNEIKKKS